MTKNSEKSDLLGAFNERYRRKKFTNLIVSFLILLFGISSFLFGLHLEPHITILRFMTVDATLFTTLGSLFYIVVNIIEVRKNTELTSRLIYYVRLSSAVAEMVILTVVTLSHMPFSAEAIPVIDRYDSFIMHAVIPALTVTSFAINDSPIGKLKPMKRWHGTWFVTCYAVISLSLVMTGVLEGSMIPYYFLDVPNNPLGLTVIAFLVVYATAYLMSWLLSELNRRLSWIWFRGFAK